MPAASISDIEPRGAYQLAPEFSRHPHGEVLSPRQELSQYITLVMPPEADLKAAVRRLQSDPQIRFAETVPMVTLGTDIICDNPNFDPPDPIVQISAPKDWHLGVVQASSAWEIQRGNASVGIVDTGIYQEHPALMDFDGSSFNFGNFHPHLSFQTGNRSEADQQRPGHPYEGAVTFGHADELHYKIVSGDSSSGPIDPNDCPNSQDGFIRAYFAGHGTHVSGLVSARSLGSGTSQGVCQDCPLIMGHGLYPAACAGIGETDPWTDSEVDFIGTLNMNSVFSSIAFLADLGAQVINFSGGFYGEDQQSEIDCTSSLVSMACKVLEYLSERDVMLFAAAGNEDFDFLQFPANDPRVFGVTGVDQQETLWNEEQGCGSNTGAGVSSTRWPHFSAPAQHVYSTMYPDRTWHPFGCHVYNDGDTNNAYGYCTGTSMASPLAAAVAALVRSANPLASVDDVFEVMRDTADNAHLTGFRSSIYGWGRPQAGDAVREMYGTEGGVQLENGSTPLFRLFSSIAEDNAYTTKPQVAVSFHHNQTWDYESYSGSNLVSGYSEFPDSPEIAASTPPRADVFVLTGHKSPYSGHDTVPLHRMRWVGSHGGNPVNADRVLVKSVAEIEGFGTSGYDLEGIEGYLIAPCSPEPGCIPSGLVRLYRAFNSSRNDHAVFPESQLAFMQAEGYDQNTVMLGYAYPN